MRVQLFRTDPPSLVAALTEPATVVRYQEAVAAELPGLADRALIRHLRRLTTAASRVLGEGFEGVARADLALADELLSDVLAVATFHGWPLPLEGMGEQELAVEDLPRGLLGADRAADSARVYLLDGTTIAFARARDAGDEADLSGHARA